MEGCGIPGCPGEYEERAVAHLERWNGKPVVIDHVPATVCAVCEDVQFAFATIEPLDALRQAPPGPTGAAPHYEYAEDWAFRPLVAVAQKNCGERSETRRTLQPLD